MDHEKLRSDKMLALSEAIEKLKAEQTHLQYLQEVCSKFSQTVKDNYGDDIGTFIGLKDDISEVLSMAMKGTPPVSFSSDYLGIKDREMSLKYVSELYGCEPNDIEILLEEIEESEGVRGAKIIDDLFLIYEFWPKTEPEIIEDNSIIRKALNYFVEIMGKHPDLPVSMPLAICLRNRGLIE